MYLALNNLSLEPEVLDLRGIKVPEVELRRLGRAADFTMTYVEETVSTPEQITLAGREAVMLVADYGKPIPQRGGVNEVVCYGDKVAVPLSDAQFTVKVPNIANIDYAQLRVAVTRLPTASKEPVITLNGVPIDFPLEDCADRFTDLEYAVTKLAYVDPKLLKSTNRVDVSFPDGDEGAVGSVVIRAAVRK